MRRHDKGERRDQEEVDARLDALQRSGSRRARRKRRSNAGPALLGVVLVLGILGVIYFIYSAATGGEDGSQKSARVQVVRGDTLSDVAAKLEEAGAIESAFVFELQARYEGYGTEIKTGHYTFRPGQASGEILHELTVGKAAPTITVTIPEGLTIEETAGTVAADSGVTAPAFEDSEKTSTSGG